MLSKQWSLAAGQNHSIGTLVGHLQDAVMIGIGLMQHDLRSSSSEAVLVRTVSSGRGVFYAHGAEVFVVWAASTDEVFGCYCSCGGDELNENVGARVRTGVSSSCTHAVAYSLALRAVSIHVMSAPLPSLLHQYSVLNGIGVKDTNVDAFPVFKGADGHATHVVAYNKILCIVQTLPTLAKHRRPICCHVPCRTRNVRCLHSFAVKQSAAGYSRLDESPVDIKDADGAARADGRGGEADTDSDGERDDGGGLNDASGNVGPNDGETGTQAHHGQAPVPPPPFGRGARGKKGELRVLADTHRLRQARNQLP
eukprot:TRINITY_DN2968_c0_g1_i2.p1 TRINITY_DN2968_c0_g1~~TRINITY_DN2968_c0_g1_i2.p1  ORF type:complete len:310 (+),score=43.41 TRINITY_DN2968_c0_g1_i2:831-1760(+)